MIWIGAGIVGFVWPHITIFIVAVLIGWAFLVLGIFDIVDSIRNHFLPFGGPISSAASSSSPSASFASGTRVHR